MVFIRGISSSPWRIHRNMTKNWHKQQICSLPWVPVFIDITTDWPGGAVLEPRWPDGLCKWFCGGAALTDHLIHKVVIWLRTERRELLRVLNRLFFLQVKDRGYSVWSLWPEKIWKMYKNLLKSSRMRACRYLLDSERFLVKFHFVGQSIWILVIIWKIYSHQRLLQYHALQL